MSKAVVYRINKETITLESLAQNEDGTWRWTASSHEIHEFDSLPEAAAAAILEGGHAVPREGPPPPKKNPRSPGEKVLKPRLRDWYSEWDERTHDPD